MYKKINQRGAILPILVIILLLLGIMVGTGLLKVPKIFNSKAGGGEITIRKADGTPLTKAKQQNLGLDLDETDSLDIQIDLNPAAP